MNADAVIKIIIVLLVFVIPAVFRMITKFREAQEAGEAPRPPRPAGNEPARREPGKPVQDEIEEFLTRVTEARKAKGQSGQGKPRRGQTPARPQEPVVAQVVEAKPVGGAVDAFVKQHLDSSDITQRASHMGEGVAAADEKFDKRLQQTFEHRLGSLGNTANIQPQQPSEAETAAAAASLVPGSFAAPGALMAMFSDPEAVRNAVLMHEILQRHEQRWG